jgi:hypothetical protein
MSDNIKFGLTRGRWTKSVEGKDIWIKDYGDWQLKPSGTVTYSFQAPTNHIERKSLVEEFKYQLETAFFDAEKGKVEVAPGYRPWNHSQGDQIYSNLWAPKEGTVCYKHESDLETQDLWSLPTDNPYSSDRVWYWNSDLQVFTKLGYAKIKSWKQYLQFFSFEDRVWEPSCLPSARS